MITEIVEILTIVLDGLNLSNDIFLYNPRFFCFIFRFVSGFQQVFLLKLRRELFALNLLLSSVPLCIQN